MVCKQKWDGGTGILGRGGHNGFVVFVRMVWCAVWWTKGNGREITCELRKDDHGYYMYKHLQTGEQKNATRTRRGEIARTIRMKNKRREKSKKRTECGTRVWTGLGTVRNKTVI